MQGAERPQLANGEIGESPNQAGGAEVIMAMRLCPVRLQLLLLKINAGRRFWEARSGNGNGTVTTSQGSQVTERLLVFGRSPLGQSIRERRMKGAVEGFYSPQPNIVAWH